MSTITAMDVANFFIELSSGNDDEEITNMKVNKMIYYAQGWSLAILDKPLFSDPLEAWEHGPVVRSVYKAFQPCGKNNIMAPYGEYDSSLFDAQQLQLLLDVFIEYSKYSAIGLRGMTHMPGTPWHKVYIPNENNLISLDDMREYFKKQTLPRFDIRKLLENTPSIGTRDSNGRLILPKEWDDAI